MEQNKTSKYFKYAIGEIILVVIGILIALQINNWNQERQLNKRELILLNELKSNLEVNVTNLNKDIKIQKESIFFIEYIMNLKENQTPFNDSIPKYLQRANFAPDVILASSAFETLKSTGLELIKDDYLRQEIINLFEIEYPFLMQETKRLEDQMWSTLVMPLYQKHFIFKNHSWIPNNYDEWLKDQEFFNMLSFRLALREQSTNLKTITATKTKNVVDLIEQELIHRGSK
jgi:hypothetical protein